ncbi:winged helix-turn-helix transcriptional regulator [Actinomadura opuntiae]|uniref:winged helix-turn-helix transcriptional regulator n=1 Tax=Actinomadura sp. OS1-43 TaxID=604315 RepID=UPI00255B2C81|nr:helix-turn-helix domain-containing protein [Actinomadura sp. OS1-43]MDL4813419.1 helix-turn-helix domain-containing protein [Actinomadura sp. OS1-43]
MESTRTYGEACATAHALDLIGERWALLVVRELLFGPKRFTDLRAGLPNAGPNRLSRRLRELEGLGLVRRRRLAPPSASWVYELTDWGRELEPVLVALGRWGRRSPFRDLDAHVSSDAIMLALRDDFSPAAGGGLDATYAIRFGEDHYVVRVAAGRLDIERGDADRPDAAIDTDARTFASLMIGSQSLEEAVRSGRAALSGAPEAFERLLAAFTRPEVVPSP